MRQLLPAGTLLTFISFDLLSHPWKRWLQAAALLDIYADALAVTEVAHGFWAVGRQPGRTNQPDVDITQLGDAQWFYTM